MVHNPPAIPLLAPNKQHDGYNACSLVPTFKGAGNTSLIRALCGEPSPRFWRAVGSLLLAFPITLFVGIIADKGHLPGPVSFLLSPGYVVGLLATQNVSDFGKSLSESMLIWFSVDLVYWSSILFGLLSLRTAVKGAN